MRYLLITHIPFTTDADGNFLLDHLWSEDLTGLVESLGDATLTIAAPHVPLAHMQAWGTGFATRPPTGPIRFTALPTKSGRFDLFYTSRLRKALKPAVENADLVHTSNLFGNDVALYYAHDLATRLGKKTLFVVAEDFPDMLGWEWLRTAPTALDSFRRRRTLAQLDRHVRARVRTASLVFLHTPAAVTRYRLDAQNAFAIRQPVHEAADVIAAPKLASRSTALIQGAPLSVVTASRMSPLKGLDMLLRAIALLRDRGTLVRLTLHGGGPQQPALEALTQRLGITDRVTFGGSLAQGPPLRHALEQHHVFAMPHLTTDFGRGFFDAIAAGLPVVAFRSPASADTVRDEQDGLLVANADVEALAAALGRLAKDPELAAELAESARTRALENTRTEWNRLRASWVKDLF